MWSSSNGGKWQHIPINLSPSTNLCIKETSILYICISLYAHHLFDKLPDWITKFDYVTYLLPLKPNSVWYSCVQSHFFCQLLDQSATPSQWNNRILIPTVPMNFSEGLLLIKAMELPLVLIYLFIFGETTKPKIKKQTTFPSRKRISFDIHLQVFNKVFGRYKRSD